MVNFSRFFKMNFSIKTAGGILSQLNILFFKIQKKILQSKYIIPYQIQELELGNYKTKAQYSRKEIYAYGRNYSCLHPIYDRIETREFEQRFVYEVKDVVVDTFTGNVFDSSSSLILESSSWSESWHISGRVPGVNSKPRFKKYMQHEQSNSIVLPSNSFFHWVNEDLAPFIFLLSTRVGKNILINNKAPGYVLDFLSYHGIQYKKVERFIKLSNYEFVSKIKNNSWPDPADIRMLRDFFLKAAPVNYYENSSKIYISRLKSTRSPIFEKSLCQFLSELGWEVLYTEEMKLADQVIKFSGAQVIAGVQGAGLINAVWSNPACSLVEIARTDWRYTPVIARLSAALGIKFQSIGYTSDDLNCLNSIKIQLSSY